MNCKKITLLLALLAIGVSIFAQATMAPVLKKSILFVNGTAHLGTGKAIEKSLIGIRDGKIAEVYNANIVKAADLKYDSVVDISGKHVYPGFISPNSTLGLIEIDQVRATHDADETGAINPNIRALVAYNTDSRISPTVRSNGILMAQVTPRGGMISGSSSVVTLDGWTWEEAVYKADDGIHVNWPNQRLENPNAEKNRKDTISIETKRLQQIQQLRSFFIHAAAYLKSGFNYESNLRYEAMRSVIEGRATLFIHADHIREINEAVYFKRELKIDKMVIVGGYDAWRVPELLKDNKVSVILQRVHSLPKRMDEDVDLPYRIPKLLDDAGVLFCLENAGSMERMGVRNLPFYAGTARAYGLDAEKAVQVITLNTARILGLDKTLGSIEEGKDATLFISTGDALDIRGNNVEFAMINGRPVDLNNHHKELYRKYSSRYGQQFD